MTTRITAAPGADGTPENSLNGLIYALSLPVDAVLVEVCRRPGVPGYAPASLADLFLPWEAVRQTVSSLSDVVLYGTGTPAADGIRTPDWTGSLPRASDKRAAQADGAAGSAAQTDKAAGSAVWLDAAADPYGAECAAVTLREAMGRVAPHPPIKLHCHLREGGLEEAVCVLALECGLAGRLILSGKLDLSLCAGSPLIRKIAEVYVSPEDQLPSFYRGYREIPGYDAQAARQLAELCAWAGSTTAHIRQDVVTRRFIQGLSARGVGVSAWTVDEAEELRWFVSAGAADICTRNIAPALAVRG